MARLAAWILLVAIAGVLPAGAQVVTSDKDLPVVVTTGEGVVKRAPDRAWVMIAAESRARTPQDAQRANSETMTAVMQRLKTSGIAGDAIQTTMFDLQPEFDYANGKQTLRGYVARNQVQVRVDDLPRLGDVLGAVVTGGATNVSGVRFDLKDRDAAEREALKSAVADARARADAAATGANLRIDRVLRIEEQREVIPAPPRPMMARAGIAEQQAVPIEAGQVEIRVRVSLTAAIK